MTRCSLLPGIPVTTWEDLPGLPGGWEEPPWGDYLGPKREPKRAPWGARKGPKRALERALERVLKGRSKGR